MENIGARATGESEAIQTVVVANPPTPRCAFLLRLTFKSLPSQTNAHPKCRWTERYYPEAGGQWFTRSDVSVALAQIAILFDANMERFDFEDLIVKCIITVKYDVRLTKRERLFMGLITDESWDKLIQLIESEHQRFPGYLCNVDIEVFGKVSSQSKRFTLEVNSPQTSPHKRRTRTVQLKKQAAVRRDINEQAGNLMLQLVEKWAYGSDTYSNDGVFCFVHPNTGKHYKISSAQQEQWANSILQSQQDASINRPPDNMYDFLMMRQSFCVLKSRNPTVLERRYERESESKSKTSAYDKLTDLLVEQTVMSMKRNKLSILRDFGTSGINRTNTPNQPIYIAYQPPPPPVFM